MGVVCQILAADQIEAAFMKPPAWGTAAQAMALHGRGRGGVKRGLRLKVLSLIL